jgi:hypothetical protein
MKKVDRVNKRTMNSAKKELCMKRVLFVFAMICVLGSLVALESAPSEVVGYVKIEAAPNVYTAISLPLEVDGMMVSEVFSDNSGTPMITGGVNPVYSDQIQQIGGGGSAWYNSATNQWVGDFVVDVTKAYYAIIRNDHPAVDLYVCGVYDNTTIVTYDDILANVYTPVGFREAGSVNASELGLMDAGFTGGPNPVLSDQIQQIGGGGSAWFNTGTGLWVGDFELTPGAAYYLVIREGHPGLSGYQYPNASSDDFTNKSRKHKR